MNQINLYLKGIGSGDDSVLLEEGRIITEEEMKEMDLEWEKENRRNEFFERHPFLKMINDKYENYKLTGNYK